MATEELKLIEAAREGDELAFAELLDQYTGFIYKLASKHFGKVSQDDVLDLFQEGAIAFKRAVELYDPNEKASFATYAYRWVEQAIHRYIVKNSGHIKLSTSRYRQLAKALEMREAGKNDAYIADELNITMSVLQDIFRSKLPMIGLENEISEEGALSLHDVLHDNREPLEDMLSFGNGANNLYQWISELEPQIQEIVSMRWGLFGQPERTIDEIAQIMTSKTGENWNKETVRVRILRAEDMLGRKAVSSNNNNAEVVSSVGMFASPVQKDSSEKPSPEFKNRPRRRL